MKTYKKKRYKKNITRKYGGVCNITNVNWPENFGCYGNEEIVTIQKGEHVDRFGNHKSGYFLGYMKKNKPFSYTSRSLRNINSTCKNEYHTRIRNGTLRYTVYKVLKKFKVKKCKIAPAFGHTGFGIQYRLYEDSIDSNNTPNMNDMLENGYLAIIPTTIIPAFNYTNYNHG